jgi:RNA polymerase sigma-70 factor (ECF subfamily)
MSTALISDKELIGNYLNGDESSLEKLIRRHKRKVYSYILMIVKDHQLADDLFQDTFIKVINTIRCGTYKEEGKFIQWVMRIAHNLIIDHFRKAKRIPLVDKKKDSGDVLDRVKISDPSIEEAMITEQIHQDVRALIELLPEDQRQVLMMRHYNNMSFKEIADATDVSINTALGRMRYALINMRKLVRDKNLILTS